MPRRYACGDVSFEACEESVETMIVGLRAAGPPGSLAPSIWVSREPMNERDTLSMHADRKLVQLVTESREMELLATRQFDVQGRAAIELHVTWPSPRGVIEQTMVMIDDENARRVTVFSLTSPIEDAEASREIFQEMLETVRFGGETAPVVLVPSSRPEPPKEPPRLPFIPMPRHDRRCERS